MTTQAPGISNILKKRRRVTKKKKGKNFTGKNYRVGGRFETEDRSR